VEVSILSKGESLASTWPKEGVGTTTVAVNHAALVVPSFPPVNWLFMADADHLTWDTVPIGWEGFLTFRPTNGVITFPRSMESATKIWPGLEIIESTTLERVGHPELPFSSMGALWFATQYLKADVLHLHGYDLGGKNVYGNEESCERGARRWKNERLLISDVCRALRERGCVIHSYGAFQP
jgi:hypothetical protein